MRMRRKSNLEERLAKGTIRISLGHQNTEQDVQMIVDVLAKIIGHPQ